MSETLQERLSAVRERMLASEIDAFLVLIEENRRYLSGFTGEDGSFDESSGALLITPDAQLLATDSRFEAQAEQESPMYEIVIYRNGLAKELVELARRLKICKLGFESGRVSVQQYHNFQKEFKSADSNVELIAIDEMVEPMRLIKSTDEIEKTRAALAIAEEAFRHVVKTLKPGMTEKSVAWAMEMGMRQAGADSLSFPVIVAAGPNSAMPHAIPSDREIQAGEPILFDWGARLDGYCSDTSRTVLIGPPDERFIHVYETTLEAQRRAIAAIRDGISSKKVDAKARDYIHQSGYEGKFGHGLGHGTGLAIHEAPRLSPLKETTLQSGMLVTVEPGIYLPGWGGVRIENQVVVEADGPMVLNSLNTSYIISEI